VQRLLLLEIDDVIEANGSMAERRASLNAELLEALRPPKLAGPGNVLEAVRRSYTNNKISLQLEGLPVDDLTPSFQFWEYITAIEEKYRKHKSNADQHSL